MKKFLHSRDVASKGAALMIVLALVVLLTGLALAYFSRAGTDRQLAQASYNDTSADLLTRTALDIVVNDFKQEIINDPGVATRNDIQPQRSVPTDSALIPNLIRRSVRNDGPGQINAMPLPAVPSFAAAISSTPADPTNIRRGEVTSARWNRHYLIPRLNTSVDNAIDSTPVSTFIAPDWVLVTPQGPAPAPSPNAVIGRYAFAVYDEGGLLDMTLAGYPSWSGNPSATCSPTPTPWLVNVGRKGIMAFADVSALPWPSVSPSPSTRIDNIVGWRNYAMTQRTFTGFPSPSPSPIFGGETDCAKQDFYGSYLLYFGDPPFIIDSLSDKLLASTYPFTTAASYVSNNRTDQALMTRQELLKLMLSLGSSSTGYNQNVLQYMGTFSRERNRPAPDWPGLNPGGSLSEGRFNLSNLALVVPNPDECILSHGKKKGWQTGKNKNHLCGDSADVHELFGLFFVKALVIDNSGRTPGHWRYIGNVGPNPDPSATPAPHHGIDCFRGANQQNDFFQILNFALFRSNCAPDGTLAKTFAIGASLIDQYDSGEACVGNQPSGWGTGCDMDRHVQNQKYATHTTVIEYGHGNGNLSTAYGLELNYSPSDPNASVNGDDLCDQNSNNPHRPTPAPAPIPSGANATIVINHAFSTVGELGYGIDTSALPTPGPGASCAPTPGPTAVPTLKFWDNSTTPPFQYAPVLDFFSYNPISSAYPRAGIVNLYTKNAPVLAAILARTLEKDPGPSPSPSPTPVVSAADAMTAANAIVAETQRVLAGNPTYGSVQQTDLTRAIAGRLSKAAFDAVPNLAASDETKNTAARALAEMGQTRTWNLLIDVIAQTGRYKPNAQDLTGSNFVVEGEKRYWLHIALGRDLNADGTVDVLGTQLEEVIE
jgi:hypothetical protein